MAPGLAWIKPESISVKCVDPAGNVIVDRSVINFSILAIYGNLHF